MSLWSCRWSRKLLTQMLVSSSVPTRRMTRTRESLTSPRRRNFWDGSPLCPWGRDSPSWSPTSARASLVITRMVSPHPEERLEHIYYMILSCTQYSFRVSLHPAAATSSYILLLAQYASLLPRLFSIFFLSSLSLIIYLGYSVILHCLLSFSFL